jgi:hypothetical protein
MGMGIRGGGRESIVKGMIPEWNFRLDQGLKPQNSV